MDTLYLIVRIGGQRVVLPADHVESVVEIESVTPVPLVARHVVGLAALRSRVLTIVDSLIALEIGSIPLDGPVKTVIVTVEGHLYGLLVDDVDDVVSLSANILPVRAAIAGGWRRAARGMIELAGEALLLVDPAALVAGPAAQAA